ncbi:MAG: acyltransferase [Verrucomicrobia bacterium]|nr:acyltransferase [Verrucomicrobiota bacterium]
MHSTSLPYVKSLDGIRGIAVLMVMMIHSRLCPFGWVGVQFFFVLSGFLITGILHAQRTSPLKEYLGRFYWRRGLRIWPLYFAFLLVCTACFWFVRVPETLPESWRWLLTFTYNFVRISPHFTDSNYFGHFWTLCVEEQFYIVWPFVVFLLRPAWLLRLVVVLVLAGPLVRFLTGLGFATIYDTPYQISRGVHNLTTSHMDAFGIGALIALLPVGAKNWLSPRVWRIFLITICVTVCAGVCQSMMLWRSGAEPHWLGLGYATIDEFHAYVWAYSLLNLCGAALILCALADTPVSKLLQLPWLAYIGKISFGVYVLHLPILQLFLIHWSAPYHSAQGLIRFVVFLILACGLASLSFHLFETRFLNLKDLLWAGKRGCNISQQPSGSPENAKRITP